jgi:dihydrolipoamide dehydrogenase
VPKHLGIVGGGYIGLELGSVWRRLGATVTVVEMLPKIATTLDGQVGRTLDRILKRQGLAFKAQYPVVEAKVARNKVKAVLESGGETEEMTFDRLLVSIGRRPLVRGPGHRSTGHRDRRRNRPDPRG